MKQCSKCKQLKPKTEFYKRKEGKDKLQSCCKECHIATSKKWTESNKNRVEENISKWRSSNKERMNQLSGEWRKRNPEKHKNSKLKHMYGITLDIWKEMLAKQNNRCSICNVEFDAISNKPVVDHCHTTGNVRELLCTRCNTALGMVKENTNTVLNMLNYLRKHN